MRKNYIAGRGNYRALGGGCGRGDGRHVGGGGSGSATAGQ